MSSKPRQIDRRFILTDGEQTIEISRAAAFALEGSGYLNPAPSTDAEWRFRPAADFSWSEVLEVLKQSGLG
jgi:hypothetical protein